MCLPSTKINITSKNFETISLEDGFIKKKKKKTKSGAYKVDQTRSAPHYSFFIQSKHPREKLFQKLNAVNLALIRFSLPMAAADQREQLTERETEERQYRRYPRGDRRGRVPEGLHNLNVQDTVGLDEARDPELHEEGSADDDPSVAAVERHVGDIALGSLVLAAGAMPVRLRLLRRVLGRAQFARLGYERPGGEARYRQEIVVVLVLDRVGRALQVRRHDRGRGGCRLDGQRGRPARRREDPVDAAVHLKHRGRVYREQRAQLIRLVHVLVDDRGAAASDRELLRRGRRWNALDRSARVVKETPLPRQRHDSSMALLSAQTPLYI